jgi:protein-tyrosine-phosphatase
MAEALLNTIGKSRFKAFSAGSHPTGTVNKHALEALSRANISTEGLRSKSWHEFETHGAPQMDLVFTVCDSAAGEACPTWPGHPMTAHWGIDDPASVAGSEDEIIRAFNTALITLKRRIDLLTMLPMEKLDNLTLTNSIREIGKAQ